MNFPIGIDLGTTNSCVAVYRDSKVEVIANEIGSRTTPSCIAFTETERLIGNPAKNQATMNPERTIFDIKRFMGKKFNDPLLKDTITRISYPVSESETGHCEVKLTYKEKEYKFTPEELSSMILSKMKKIAEDYLGTSVQDAVITVPAYFNDAERQATKQAAEIAGLNVIRIINEPTAAALAYGLQNCETTEINEKNIIVIDTGGSTHDVSLLQICNGFFEVKATAGDIYLGGTDFDNAFQDYIINCIVKKLKIDITKIKESKKTMKRIRVAVERGKRTLSHQTTAQIEIDSVYEGQDFTTNITRSRFNMIIEELMNKIMKPVNQVLKDSQINPEIIDEIVLVGGSSRIPIIREMIAKKFPGKKINCTINPDEAIAYGAAVQAAILSKNEHKELNDILLLDVVPLTLGVETTGGLMSAIIPRNTGLPITKTQSYSTHTDDQESVKISVFEGERRLTKNNNLLGIFELSGIVKAPRGAPRIDIQFKIDESGILAITAKDRTTKSENSLIVTNETKKLSSEDIKRMIEEADILFEDDKKAAELIEERNRLENLCYQIETNKKANIMKAKNENTEKLLKKLDETVEWLEEDGFIGSDTPFEEYTRRHDDLEKLFNKVGFKKKIKEYKGDEKGEYSTNIDKL